VLEKQKKAQTQNSERKEIMKIIAKINEIESKIIQRVNETVLVL
jgi:hypothetical protein